MGNKTLLSLDMSTTCTGWALFNVDEHTLITYGFLKGKTFKDSSSIRMTLKKCQNMSERILQLIENYKPSLIVIEEITGSKNRIGQKTLDILHGIVWTYIEKYLDIVEYYDVSGSSGWRTDLNLRLNDADKLANKEAKKLNPQLGKGVSKMPVYNAKDLSARYANTKFGLNLDVQTNQSDADVADAVSMGSSYIQFKFPRN